MKSHTVNINKVPYFSTIFLNLDFLGMGWMGGGVLSNHDLTKMHKHEVTICLSNNTNMHFYYWLTYWRGETLSSQPGEWPYSVSLCTLCQWPSSENIGQLRSFTSLYYILKNQLCIEPNYQYFGFFFKHSFLNWHWIYCVSILQDVYVPALNVCMQASCFGVTHNQKILTEIIKKKINKFKYHSVSFISHPRRS